jgi:hypothetical protein
MAQSRYVYHPRYAPDWMIGVKNRKIDLPDQKQLVALWSMPAARLQASVRIASEKLKKHLN